MIDLKEILLNSNYKKETEELINIANLAYKRWETYWTGFNSTYVCEEILKDFENLNDFKFFIYGGFSLSLIHISEPTRRTPISYAVFCLKTKLELNYLGL